MNCHAAPCHSPGQEEDDQEIADGLQPAVPVAAQPGCRRSHETRTTGLICQRRQNSVIDCAT